MIDERFTSFSKHNTVQLLLYSSSSKILNDIRRNVIMTIFAAVYEMQFETGPSERMVNHIRQIEKKKIQYVTFSALYHTRVFLK